MSDASTQVQTCEQRVLAVARDITALLATDIREYPDRELQRRFMADPQRAESVTDSALKKLRAEATELAAELAARLPQQLEEPELWLRMADGEAELPTGKELQLIPAVWAELRSIDRAFEELATRYGLEDDRSPPGYQPPRRFVRRMYLPTLVETCLRELNNLRNLRKAERSENEALARQSLSARWAAAAPDE